jgi:Flp pilus assembly protein CpaB
MRGRLLIVVAFIILIVAIVAFLFISRQGPTPPPGTGTPATRVAAGATVIPTEVRVPVVVALQELPRGYRFPDTVEGLESVVGVRFFPEDSAPFNGISEVEDLLGQIARTDIYREEPILVNMVVQDFTSLANVGSDAAAVLPSNLVAVSIPIDRQTSVAYAVQQGDRVDVIVSMLFVDVDEPFQTIVPNNITLVEITEDGIELSETIPGRPESTSLGFAIIGPSERQRPRLVTQRTIQDALVVYVGDFPRNGRFLGVTPLPPTPTGQAAQPTQAGSGQGTPVPTPTPARPDIITLGVTPQDAVFLTWVVEAKLPVTLALRSASTGSARDVTEAVTLDYVLSTYRIDPPAKRNFSIEPAIRSIRQLIAGQEISLSEAQPSTQPNNPQ